MKKSAVRKFRTTAKIPQVLCKILIVFINKVANIYLICYNLRVARKLAYNKKGYAWIVSQVYFPLLGLHLK